MKLSVLVDNSVYKHRLKAEHGLSYFLETERQKLLFDTGASDLLLANANILQTPLDQLTAVILSHSHYDHSGGFAPLLGRLARPTTCYIGPGFFRTTLKKDKNQYYSIGPPLHRSDYERLGAQFKEILEPLPLDDQWTIIGGFKPAPVSYFYTRKGPEIVPDPFTEELSLAYHTSEHLVLFTGCSHSGLTSIIKHTREIIPDLPMVIFGGFHTSRMNHLELESLTQTLVDQNVIQVGLSHCTGSAAQDVFAEKGIRVMETSVGQSFIF